ncbi:MAG: hypothetical protein Ta2B_08620 [Termitinemataceae bacterium]|nr:MAG: hypothetical protein Ta2B_08620 [Termitinemataceae bacterium]
MFEFDEETFKTEKAKWGSLNIANYTFTCKYSAPPPNEYYVVSSTVENKVNTHNEMIEDPGLERWMNNEALDEETLAELTEIKADPMHKKEVRFSSIDVIYRHIEKFVSSEKENYDAGTNSKVRIKVTYDKKYHYPTAYLTEVVRVRDTDLTVIGGDGSSYLYVSKFEIPEEE